MQPATPDFDLSSFTPPSEPRRPGWPPAAQAAVGCGTGCAVLVLLEGVVAALVLSATLNMHPTEGLVARVEAPPKAIAGQKFAVTLVVRNEGERAFKISSITARHSRTQTVMLSNPRPAPSSVVSTPSLLGMPGTEIWSYDRSVEPGKELRVQFDAEAREKGAAKGALEVHAGGLPKEAPFSVDVAAAK
jgi:hypothetical protein